MRIGVDLGGTKIEAVVLADDGSERVRQRIAAPRGSYSRTLDAIVALVRGVEARALASGLRGDGPASSVPVGIGIPGAISPATGRVKNANSTWLIGEPLAIDLERALGRPVRIENDANCFAVSEATDGAAAGARVVFGVILGTGVGGGLVVDGRVIAGRMAIAGEWGHNRLPATDDRDLAALEWPGPACYCGRRGCIETFLCGPGWLARHHEIPGVPRVESAAALVGAMRAGDPRARESFDRYVDRLARALAMVINIIDPDAIVVGGGLSAVGELYEAVPRVWDRYVFSDRVDTPLLAPRHGDSSGVRGAAWLWPPADL
jgi:fructokinase